MSNFIYCVGAVTESSLCTIAGHIIYCLARIIFFSISIDDACKGNVIATLSSKNDTCAIHSLSIERNEDERYEGIDMLTRDELRKMHIALSSDSVCETNKSLVVTIIYLIHISLPSHVVQSKAIIWTP